jgi:SAM-dependent methyltransferase
VCAESVRFDRAAHFYDATRGFPPGVEDDVAQLLVEAGGIEPGSRILEVGVGTGRIALPLSRRGGTVYGVDLSRPMLERLRARRRAEPVHVALGDATRLPYRDESFDAAVAVHVFHLIPAWREVLAELSRVLRPGAVLLNAGDGPNPLWTGYQELMGRRVRDVGVARERMFDFLLDEGWTARSELRRISYPTSLTPQQSIALLEARSPSSTWRLSDGELAELVAEARRIALERFGDLDTPLELERNFLVRAHLRPASAEGARSEPEASVAVVPAGSARRRTHN